MVPLYDANEINDRLVYAKKKFPLGAKFTDIRTQKEYTIFDVRLQDESTPSNGLMYTIRIQLTSTFNFELSDAEAYLRKSRD